VLETVRSSMRWPNGVRCPECQSVEVTKDGIRTLIPPERGRPSEKSPAGRWRRWMRQQFARFKAKYGQRWQGETVNSMIKRMIVAIG
jgi:hypothetical protein